MSNNIFEESRDELSQSLLKFHVDKKDNIYSLSVATDDGVHIRVSRPYEMHDDIHSNALVASAANLLFDATVVLSNFRLSERQNGRQDRPASFRWEE